MLFNIDVPDFIIDRDNSECISNELNFMFFQSVIPANGTRNDQSLLYVIPRKPVCGDRGNPEALPKNISA
jgi:hypothetical protein